MRSEVVLNWLRSGKSLGLESPREQAAQARMEELIANPRGVLNRVQGYMTGSFQKLYRRRTSRSTEAPCARSLCPRP